MPNSKVLEFLEDGVRVQHVVRSEDGCVRDEGKPTKLTGFDYVVVAMGARAYNPLEGDVRTFCGDVYVVGDAAQAQERHMPH